MSTLDTHCFRAFAAAAETLNFTEAARRASMTQSGISQHIARLEEQTGTQLFERRGKSVALTEAGRRMARYIESCRDSERDFLDAVRAEKTSLIGNVSYAMPPSCLLSPHLGMLIDKKRDFPGLTLDVTVGPNDMVYDMVQSGRADFGFVTSVRQDAAVLFRRFCQEAFVIVGADSRVVSSLTAAELARVPVINYPGMTDILDRWIAGRRGGSRHRAPRSLTIAASVNAIDGAIKMALGGIGVTAIPRHCVQSFLDEKRLFANPRNERDGHVLNDIHIVTPRDRVIPRRVRQVIDWFVEMHPNG